MFFKEIIIIKKNPCHYPPTASRIETRNTYILLKGLTSKFTEFLRQRQREWLVNTEPAVSLEMQSPHCCYCCNCCCCNLCCLPARLMIIVRYLSSFCPFPNDKLHMYRPVMLTITPALFMMHKKKLVHALQMFLNSLPHHLEF